MRRTLLLLAFIAWPGIAPGAPPFVPGDFTYRQRLGDAVPMATVLRDDSGAPVQLAGVADGKPLILALVYFHCPNLCGVVRADLFDALGRTGLVAGRDYELAAISIDTNETSADAARAKADDLAHFGVPGAARSWHYLTGDAAGVRAVAQSVGFRDRFDAASKQFLHPAGIVFVTSAGVVSGYLLGVGYRPGDIRAAVTRAAGGGIARASLPILLLCFHYDPTTGRYSLAILKLLQIAAGITVLAIGGTLFLAFRRERAP